MASHHDDNTTNNAVSDARGKLAKCIEDLVSISNTHPSICPIDEVPGAFMVHQLLTPEECDDLQKCVVDVANYIENKEVLLSHNEKPRRNSQHHTPCHVESAQLKNISCRLRPFLPQVAGPSPSACDVECELEPQGMEISTFLRCYHYKVGDFSTPHYDRSQYEYEDISESKQQMSPDNKDNPNKPQKRAPSRLVRFSAYSILFYLNDNFEGGATTFLSAGDSKRSRRGLTPVASSTQISSVGEGNGEGTCDLVANGDDGNRNQVSRVSGQGVGKVVVGGVVRSVQPRKGSVLVFPHGQGKGRWPDPLHEGSVITEGCKTIIRTDIMYSAPKKKNRNKQKKDRNRRAEAAEAIGGIEISPT